MNTNKLANNMKVLNKHFRNINRGGCGRVALSLYKALERNGIRCVIRTEANHIIDKDMRVNSFLVEHFKTASGPCSGHAGMPNYHIWIELDGVCMDSDGPRRANHCVEPLNPQLLDKWLDLDEWNDCFVDSNFSTYGPNLVHALDAVITGIVDYTLLDDSEVL